MRDLLVRFDATVYARPPYIRVAIEPEAVLTRLQANRNLSGHWDAAGHLVHDLDCDQLTGDFVFVWPQELIAHEQSALVWVCVEINGDRRGMRWYWGTDKSNGGHSKILYSEVIEAWIELQKYLAGSANSLSRSMLKLLRLGCTLPGI